MRLSFTEEIIRSYQRKMANADDVKFSQILEEITV